MLCIINNSMDAAPLVLDEKLIISRAYISNGDLPSFPNRLHFTITKEELQKIITAVIDDSSQELVEEAQHLLSLGVIHLTVPIALRVQDETYASFRQRANLPEDRVQINTISNQLFMRGIQVPSICAACSRQATLKGKACPDYVADSFACFKTNNFSVDYMQAFYLNEKGELVYNATCVETESNEQAESSADTSAN